MLKINNPNLKFKEVLQKRTSTKYIVLHHAEAQHCTVQDIHAWHLANGWAGIGYNYFIRKDGSIYQGRPENVIGAHCQGSNSISIGICLEGDYEKLDKTMPTAQYNAVIALIKDINTRYKGLVIKGHKELYATACPGQYYPLNKIKSIFGQK